MLPIFIRLIEYEQNLYRTTGQILLIFMTKASLCSISSDTMLLGIQERHICTALISLPLTLSANDRSKYAISALLSV